MLALALMGQLWPSFFARAVVAGCPQPPSPSAGDGQVCIDPCLSGTLSCLPSDVQPLGEILLLLAICLGQMCPAESRNGPGGGREELEFLGKVLRKPYKRFTRWAPLLWGFLSESNRIR